MKKVAMAFGGVMLVLMAGLEVRGLQADPRQPAGEVKPAVMGGGFRVEQELVLPATPNEVFDAVTGDISAWWDHSFSGHPKKLYIEPKPGGGFYEIFDDAGNGALHATVIFAQRGKMLRFVGPLGLSGRAVDCVTTYELSAEPAAGGAASGAAQPGTRLKVTVAMSGEIDEATAKIVDGAWHHFLFERLKPYIESGEYKKKRTAIICCGLDPGVETGTASTSPAPQGERGMNAAVGKLTDFAWLAGRWVGTAGEATAEEICTEASHHLMSCMIRYMNAENVTELEIVTLREAAASEERLAVAGEQNVIEERVRFFSPDLAEKEGDAGITLRLASVSGTEIVFDNVKTEGVVKHLRIIRNGANAFTSHLDLVGADGRPGVIEAKWKRGK